MIAAFRNHLAHYPACNHFLGGSDAVGRRAAISYSLSCRLQRPTTLPRLTACASGQHTTVTTACSLCNHFRGLEMIVAFRNHLAPYPACNDFLGGSDAVGTLA